MKRSDIPTEYIYIKAQTDSRWDSCDFAIIRLAPEWRCSMRKRLDMIAPFIGDNSFYSHQYWESPEGFYKTPYDGDETVYDTLLGTNEEWCFVDLEEGDLKNLDLPENALSAYTLVVTQYGTGRYKAYGKHTSEEFYTEDFPIEQFINAVTDTANINLNNDQL